MSNAKIIIITQGVSRIVKPLVNQFNVVGIIEDSTKLSRNKFHPFYILFLKKIYSKFKTSLINLETFSRNKQIPYYLMDNSDTKNLSKWIQSLKADIMVVYSMSRLLKREIFDLPKYKTINLHPSLLPQYRGPNPWFWTYYNFDKFSGVTLHFIDDGEDTGDIIYQQSYEIPLGINSIEMQNQAIGKIGLDLICKAVINYKNLPRKKQNFNSEYQRARRLKNDEHKTVIQWDEFEIERIWHILRGTQTWLDAIEAPKGLYAGHRWEILNFKKQNMDRFVNSKIYYEMGSYFLACRDGKIFLKINFSMIKFLYNLIN